MSSSLLRFGPCFLLLAATAPSMVQAQECHCHTCMMARSGAADGESAITAEAHAALFANEELFGNLATRRSSATLGAGTASGAATGDTQVVFLDFDSGTTPYGVDLYSGARDEPYSAFERQEVLQRVEEDYELFDFEFTLSQPDSGEYSTILMNEGPLYGRAEQIDFRNLNRSDNATVNIPSYVTANDQDRVVLTSTVVSHELGHILGLRHADAFGPIGSGVNPESFAVIGFEFPGPEDAAEAAFHIMQTDADNGDPYETFFGERSSVKLAANENGSVIAESANTKDFFPTAQPINLAPLTVPNTLRAGEFADTDFVVDALTITGSLSLNPGETSDFFSFEAEAGDVLYAEVISNIMNPSVVSVAEGRFTDTIAPRLQVFDEDGNVLSFFDSNAVNRLGPEFIDAALFDVLIPESGTYFVSVDGDGITQSEFDWNGDGTIQPDEIFPTADSTPQTGGYELFLFTFGVDTGDRAESDGDFNGDGVVDSLDYMMLRETLAMEVDPGTGADGNANGLIDPEDYRYWLGNYAAQYAPGAVPEPATAALLVIFVVGVALRREV